MVINMSNAAVTANDFFRVVNGIISSVGFRMYVQDTGEGNNKYKMFHHDVMPVAKKPEAISKMRFK